MRYSRKTLFGRVHVLALLEVEHEVEALYEMIDPVLRAQREKASDNERDLALSGLGAFVQSVRSAEVDKVEILEASKACEQYGGRPAARVRRVVRYNGQPNPEATTTVWVRDEGVWYATALGERPDLLQNESCEP